MFYLVSFNIGAILSIILQKVFDNTQYISLLQKFMDQVSKIVNSQLLEKYGLIKNYSVDDIVLVKIDNDEHEWPAKISEFFIQTENNKTKKSQSQDDYCPSKKNKKGKKQKVGTKQQLIYKVRYFELQSFCYISQKNMKPYSLKLQKQLEKIKDKRFQKAMEKARSQMKLYQKQKLDKQRLQKPQKTQKKQKQKNKNVKVQDSNRLTKSCMNINDELNSSFTTQAQRVQKKQIKKQKASRKKTIPIKKKNNLLQTFSEQKIELPVNSQNKKPQVVDTNQIQKRVQQALQPNLQVKQQHNEVYFQKNLNQSVDSEIEVQQQYLLDNVLFKNKFQILGIFSDLLQEFLGLVLWFDPKQIIKISSKYYQKINTLNKIVDAEIFKYEELQESKCLKKMLNIIRIGELTSFPVKLIQNSLKKELNETYFKIMNLLKKINLPQKQVVIFQVNNQSLEFVNPFSKLNTNQLNLTQSIQMQQRNERLSIRTKKSQKKKSLKSAFEDDKEKLKKLKQDLKIDYTTKINISPL